MVKTNDYDIMAYPIKNSATLQTNSIKNGSFGLGVNQGGYGLTSSTAFWNGKTPNVSGYVLYIGNGASSPTTYVAKNDNDLITLANVLGYGSFTTIGQTLVAFNTLGSLVICVNMDCPNIVVGNLTLYLDASFTPSYPKSSTKWADISGNNITASLQNGPTFNSDFYGSIVFDGSDDYVDTGTVIPFPHNSAWSIQFIVKTITFVNTFPGYLIQGNATSSGVLIFYTSDGTLFWKHNNIGYVITTTTFGNVYDIAITYSGSGNVKAYVNGVFVANVGTMASTDSTNTLLLGRGDQFSNNNQYTFLRYSRELSAAEVLQNYYAGKKRFIPTNGLVMWLDGENTNTRVITPTTAIDVSDNDYNGSLINGTSLKHFDAGTSFNFDGTNDYITCGNIMPTGNYTKVVIFKLTNFSSYSNNLVSGGPSGSHYLYLAGTQFLRAGHFNGGEAVSSYTTLNNTWNFAVVTFSTTSGFSIYQNGNTVVGSNSSTGGFTGGNVLLLGSYGEANLLQGQIGISMIYNRVLTSTEILDIYTAYKGRFGYV
jgi:hypothetical protein